MEEVNYLQKFYEELILERQERAFEKFFNYSYNYFKRGNGQILLKLHRADYFIIYRYLRAFANNSSIEKIFDSLKNSLVKQPIYNIDYWHLDDGYLNESCTDFYTNMFNIKKLTNTFGSFLKEDLATREPTAELNTVLINFIDVCDDILREIDQNARMNSYQFAEIVTLKNLKKVFTNILNGVAVEVNIITI